jgi:Kef-type K+ transport system membrane component KefB
MPELDFLPSWPPSLNAPLLVGLMLLLGVVGGELARRFLALPRITGYVAVGIALGVSGLGWLRPDQFGAGRIVLDVPLGIILFELGRRVDLQWLRRDKWLALTSVTESVATFTLIFFALRLYNDDPLFCAIAAAIGISTAPEVVMLVALELKAEGEITERSLMLTALNGVIAFYTLTILLPWLHRENAAPFTSVTLHPLYLLIGSTLLGFIAARLAIVLARWLGKREDRQLTLIIGLIVLTVGVARLAQLSVLIALLSFGILARNLDRRHDLMPVEFGHGIQLMFVLLFVVTGAGLQIEQMIVGWSMAALYIGARFAGKFLGVMTFSIASGIRWRRAGLLSIALSPMSALAVAMVLDTGRLYPQFGSNLAVIVLTAVGVLEIIGPLATQFALVRAGEAHPEKRDLP